MSHQLTAFCICVFCVRDYLHSLHEKYSSTLQTTSYNFSKRNMTPEVYAAVVSRLFWFFQIPSKACSWPLKTPSQQRRAQTNIARHWLKPKEVQYWWTQKYLQTRRLATLVTACSSGSSYFNRVKLQSGCMTRGHSFPDPDWMLRGS